MQVQPVNKLDFHNRVQLNYLLVCNQRFEPSNEGSSSALVVADALLVTTAAISIILISNAQYLPNKNRERRNPYPNGTYVYPLAMLLNEFLKELPRIRNKERLSRR